MKAAHWYDARYLVLMRAVCFDHACETLDADDAGSCELCGAAFRLVPKGQPSPLPFRVDVCPGWELVAAAGFDRCLAPVAPK